MTLKKSLKRKSSRNTESKRNRLRISDDNDKEGSSVAGSKDQKGNKVPTEFEERVYRMAKRIPRGKVTSYGVMSKALNSSARAVGQALRKNPYAPQVPCHRIISSSFHIGGFSGATGINHPTVGKKINLLGQEGVNFDSNGKLCNIEETFLTSI